MKMHGRTSSFVLATLLLIGAAGAQAQDAAWTGNPNWAQLPGGATEWGGATTWVETDGKGTVIVMVRSAPYFRVFNRDGSFVRQWGDEGMFVSAHSITLDPAGFLWATDSNNHVVYKLSLEGEILQTLGKPGEVGDNSSTTLFNRPNHVEVAANGDIYVSDGYVNSRIVHFSPAGEFIRIIGGLEGVEPGQLKVPHGIAVDSRGRIIVNDSDNQRISVFDPDGKFLETWPFPSRGGIVITADDTVYVSDVNAGAVSVIKDGVLLESIPVEGRPHGLAVDSDGAIYTADPQGARLTKVTRN